REAPAGDVRSSTRGPVRGRGRAAADRDPRTARGIVQGAHDAEPADRRPRAALHRARAERAAAPSRARTPPRPRAARPRPSAGRAAAVGARPVPLARLLPFRRRAPPRLAPHAAAPLLLHA